jgi:hypothetical protein
VDLNDTRNIEPEPERGIQRHLNVEGALSNSRPAWSPMSGSELLSVHRPCARRRAAGIALALVMVTMLMFGAPPAQAKLYKWVDDKGVVHYTDSMPPDAVNKGSVELSKQGVQIRKTEPATSPENRRAREEEEERLKQIAKEQQETARRDRAVLDSYTSEEDIDLARKRSLKTVEQALQSAQAYIDQLTKRKEAILAARADPKDRTPAAAAERDIARIDSDIARQAELVARKRTEMTTLISKYDVDKARWRAAKARTEGQRTLPAPAASAGAGSAQAGKPGK